MEIYRVQTAFGSLRFLSNNEKERKKSHQKGLIGFISFKEVTVPSTIKIFCDFNENDWDNESWNPGTQTKAHCRLLRSITSSTGNEKLYELMLNGDKYIADELIRLTQLILNLQSFLK